MSELEKVIALHEKQVGYTCENKQSKYAKDIDDHMDTWQWYNGKKCGFDWCTCYFDDIMINALGVERARKALNRPKNSLGAAVRYSREYLKEIGRVGNVPKVGCAVYFGSLPYPYHIGFVYKVTDKMIYTYEGNCYVSNNVSGVKTRSYSRSYSEILDYGYPVYDEEPGPKELDGYKVGDTYEVKVDDLSVRTGAGTSFNQTGTLKKGTKIVCLALESDSKKNTWLMHRYGWSCGDYEGNRYIDEPKKTGWIRENGKWYYYDSNGEMVKSKWIKYKGGYYYLGANGAMYTGWRTIDGDRYYFYPEGHMASAEWVSDSDKGILFLDADGRQTYQKKGSWKKNSKGQWFEVSGWYPTSRWLRINRKDYEFDSDGYLVEK